MTGKRINRRQVLRLGAGASALALLSGCDTMSFGLPSLGNLSLPTAKPQAGANQSFGTGPVKVALLLPLSGDAGLAATGVSMANAAQLAMDYLAEPAQGDRQYHHCRQGYRCDRGRRGAAGERRRGRRGQPHPRAAEGRPGGGRRRHRP